MPTAEWLLEHGADVEAPGSSGLTGLMLAASTGSDEVLAVLLGRGANALVQDGQGNTALHHAGKHGHNGCWDALLNAKAVGAGAGAAGVRRELVRVVNADGQRAELKENKVDKCSVM